MNVENQRDKYKEQEYLDGAEEAVKCREKQNWISIGAPYEKRQADEKEVTSAAIA